RAKKAVQLALKEGNYWQTLGVAHYRAGDWKAAALALNKSLELGPSGAVNWLFLAMAQQKLGKHDEARRAYEHAVQWLERNRDALEKKDKQRADELRRFRAEAEEVLELKKKIEEQKPVLGHSPGTI